MKKQKKNPFFSFLRFNFDKKNKKQNEKTEKKQEKNKQKIGEILQSEPLIQNKQPINNKLKAAFLRKEEKIRESIQVIAEKTKLVNQKEKNKKENFFAHLKDSLLKTREHLSFGVIELFRRSKKINSNLFEDLEQKLLMSDIGVETTHKILTRLTESAHREELCNVEALFSLMKKEMGVILRKVDKPLDIKKTMPFVVLMVGVNGAGKTTTTAKLAYQLMRNGKSVMLAAGDTFRAAAIEQLQIWGERIHVPVIAQHVGADSASVIFDAMKAAKARKVDVLIADTAGRLQNKIFLMEELKKIIRVIKKIDIEAPHEVMLVIDASIGQNSVQQTKLFHEAVRITGITLTKLDGTAKGGVIFSIADLFNIPIRYISVGQHLQDLQIFRSENFIESLFSQKE